MNMFMFSMLNSTGRVRSLTRAVELVVADALDEVVEWLAVVALLLVEAHPALDRVGDALGREADLQALAVARPRRPRTGRRCARRRPGRWLADLDRGAVEADVRDVVLAAAVRAAAHLDVDPLASAGRRSASRSMRSLDRGVEAHRAGDAELAAVGAGAADDVGDRVGARVVEAELASRSRRRRALSSRTQRRTRFCCTVVRA